MIGAILSGGENRRIPVLKGFLSVEGRAIIERSIEVLTRLFGDVVISTNMPEKYFSLGVPLIGDIIKEKGPLIGIVSVLYATGADSVFVVACDMPFISEGLIEYMADKYRTRNTVPPPARGGEFLKIPSTLRGEGKGGGESPGPDRQWDAVIPVFRSYREPLFGIYARSAAQHMENLITEGQRSLADVLARLRVRYISEQEVRAVDPEGKSFVNINTMEDYERIGGKTCLA